MLKLISSNFSGFTKDYINSLKSKANTVSIQDINHPNNNDYELLEFNNVNYSAIKKSGKYIKPAIHSIVENIELHHDKEYIKESCFNNHVYLLLLDVIETEKTYNDECRTQYLYNNGDITTINIGDLVMFDASKIHGLFCTNRCNIVVFWSYK